MPTITITTKDGGQKSVEITDETLEFLKVHFAELTNSALRSSSLVVTESINKDIRELFFAAASALKGERK